ncbi:MAG: hypothetical protein ACI90V_010610 [Bacillariaceae sp.]|jgi:hypothetical protein
MQSADYFINNGDEQIVVDDGYWEPHTSSIDFCETNYLHSSYVVEPHNVFSSLWGLCLLGLIGMYYGNPTGEIRFKIAYGILILIGIGSAALHGTLHWIFQSADELPMIYLVISALYCLLELGDDDDDDDVTAPMIPSPSQQKDSNKNNNKKVLKYPWLPHIFVVLGIVNTLIYFRFQQIYVVFLLTFIVMIMAALILHVQIAWRQRQIIIISSSTTTTFPDNNNNNNNNNTSTTSLIIRRNNAKIALRFYVWHYVVFLGIAVPIWILDQFWCTNLLPIYNSLPYFLRGCTLHVVWHLMAGLGGYTILQFLVTCRMSVLGLPCKIQWILGIIPVVVSAAVSSRYKENTKQL